jgi:Zn-dependent peptidase ImmA (M78 family)
MKLDIGGHNYTVICENLTHEDSSKELYGRHLVKHSQILINNQIDDSRQKETLIHEILHAVLVNAGHDHDEGLIDAISNGFHQLGVGEYLWKKAQKKS